MEGLYQAAVLVCTICAVGLAANANAKTLEVGADRPFKMPSAAVATASNGDTIMIDPGEYFDCAVLTADKLTVEGRGAGATITDKTCQGKALFVTTGNNITIRNLTFARARVPDGNGAGIRAEGADLTIERSKFINNENGILAADSPRSTIRIVDSDFVRNGKCNGSCAHGVYVGEIALLHIERSRFFETKIGHHVKSRALRTELIGNQITDGAQGTSSYLVDISNGGTVIMRDNVLEKGPNSSNPRTAVMIGAEGVTHPTAELAFTGNTFTNDEIDRPAVFVRNLTATEAQLSGNTFKGHVIPLEGDGTVR